MRMMPPAITNSPFLPAKRPTSPLVGNERSLVAHTPQFRGGKTNDADANQADSASHEHPHSTHDVFGASAQAPPHSPSVTGHQHDHSDHRHDHHHEHSTTKNPLDVPPKSIMAFFIQFFKRLKANFAMIFTGRSLEADSHTHHHHAPDEACDHPDHNSDHGHSHEKIGVLGWFKDFGKILKEDIQRLLSNDEAPSSHSSHTHHHPH
jgi:hypothetical protein